MSVSCLFIIRDIILNYVLKNYIAKTPFLMLNEITPNELLCNPQIYTSDIIFLELDSIDSEDFETIKQIIDSKPTLIISDKKDLIDIYGFQNAVCVNKSFSYSDFVNSISLLIDNQNIKTLSTTYS